MSTQKITDTGNRILRKKGIPAEISWWEGPDESPKGEEFLKEAIDSLEATLSYIREDDSKPLSVFIRNDKETGEPYVVIQFSWGGPSDEFRVYLYKDDPERFRYVEYVYQNWFVGVGFFLHANRVLGLEEFIAPYLEAVVAEAQWTGELNWRENSSRF